MVNKNKRFAQWAAGVAASLLFAATAQAIVVRGNIDPSFGPPYPNLGFDGFADVYVNNNCLSVPGIPPAALLPNNPCGAGSPMGLMRAEIGLYVFPNPLPIEQTLVYANNALPGDLLPMDDVYLGFDAGLGRNTLVGFDMRPFPSTSASPNNGFQITDPQLVGAPGSGLPPFGTPLWVYFDYDTELKSQFAYLTTCVQVVGGVLAPLGTGTVGNVACHISAPAHVTFTEERADIPVPEPGTLALVLAGLGGWFVRRRKQLAN